MIARFTRLALAAVLAMTASVGVLGQELEPRSFNNLPINETFLVVGAVRSDGDLSPPGSSPLQDAELTIDALAVGASRTFAFAGDAAKVDIAGTRVCYEGEGVFRGEFAEARRCEYGDPRMKFTWNFSGAPAMRLEEFPGWQQDIVIGASVAVSAPWGDYTSRQLINAGANRWTVKPVVGISHRYGKQWQWEAKLGATFFETNDDYFGDTRLEQDPLYSTSLHLIYNFKRGWLSLDANYFTGGRTKANGVRQDNRQDNSRWGLTWTRPVAPKHLVKLYVSTGVVTRIGNDFNSFGAAWLYRI